MSDQQTPGGGAPAAATPDPGVTFSPGRFVNADSRAAALLKATGLKPTAIPRSIEGGPADVTEAEVVAELTRRGTMVELPEPLSPPKEAKARELAQTMLDGGAFLMRVHPGRKNPVGDQWQHQPAMTADDAVAWLLAGGNLGVHPVRSGTDGWIAIDAESAAATQFFVDLGLTPTARTAKSRHPLWPEKAGGSHFWVPLPAGIDRSRLQSKLGVKLPGGGVVDLLFTNNAVAPGSRIDSAPGRRYVFDASVTAGALTLGGTEAVRFLFDPDAPLPNIDGVEHLRAAMVKQFRTPKPHDPDADRVTQEIDDISWDTWLAGYEDKVQIVGADGSCGCPVFHWWASGTGRSGILHEGCEYGWAAHIYSASLISEWDCPEHLSRLRFRAYLEGRPHRLADVARGFGVNFNKPLNGVDLSGFTYRPADIAPPTKPASTRPVIGVDRGASPADSAPQPLRAVPRIGTVGDGQAPSAAPPLVVPPGVGHPQLSAVPAVDDHQQVEEQEDTGLALFRQIEEVDATGFWDSLPILRKIHRAAVTNGVYPWGLLGAVLPRIACSIPPHVRLVGSSGKEGGREGGASLNLSNILVGAPEAGKSETIKIATDLVALPTHAKCATSGTGEGIIKSFAFMKRASGKGDSTFEPAPPDPAVVDPAHPGSTAAAPTVGSVGGHAEAGSTIYEMVHITDTVMLTDGEIASFTAEMNRQGTKLSSVLRSAWVGEQLGSTTGEIERRTFLPAHSYRMGTVLGGQVTLDALGRIFDEGNLGTPQRFGFFPVKTIPAEGDPVSSITLPPIDWYDGQAAAAYAAQLTGSVAPTWIHRPPAAHRDIERSKQLREANAHVPFSVTNAARVAEDEDSIDDKRGHELLHQLKIATVLAVADGKREPTDEHWFVAGQIMYVRELMIKVMTMVLNVQRENADRRLGRSRGVMQAAAKAAESEVVDGVMQRTCTKILKLVDAAAGQPKLSQYAQEVRNRNERVFSDGRVNVSYLRYELTRCQKPYLDSALQALRRQGLVVGDTIIGRTPVLHIVPRVGGIA